MMLVELPFGKFLSYRLPEARIINNIIKENSILYIFFFFFLELWSLADLLVWSSTITLCLNDVQLFLEATEETSEDYRTAASNFCLDFWFVLPMEYLAANLQMVWVIILKIVVLAGYQIFTLSLFWIYITQIFRVSFTIVLHLISVRTMKNSSALFVQLIKEKTVMRFIQMKDLIHTM